jgi:hypothetical protein
MAPHSIQVKHRCQWPESPKRKHRGPNFSPSLLVSFSMELGSVPTLGQVTCSQPLTLDTEIRLGPAREQQMMYKGLGAAFALGPLSLPEGPAQVPRGAGIAEPMAKSSWEQATECRAKQAQASPESASAGTMGCVLLSELLQLPLWTLSSPCHSPRRLLSAAETSVPAGVFP